MKYFLIASILISKLCFAQSEIPTNIDKQALLISKYVFQNLDSIKKYTKVDSVYIAVTFNQFGATVKSIGLYKSEFPAKDNLVNTWNELEKFLYSLFEFYPESENEGRTLISRTFKINLNRGKLENAIVNLEISNSTLSKQIAAHAKYKIFIRNIYIDKNASLLDSLKIEKQKNPLELKNVKYQSKLDYFNSGIIKLHLDCYILFTVLNTSIDGLPETRIELKLYQANRMLYDEIKKLNAEELNCVFISESFVENGKLKNKDFGIDIKIEFE